MGVLTFYIVRHGKTVFNELDLVQGWCDSPLTEQGIDDAESVGRGLKNIKFSSVYSSTLNRSKKTAEIALATKDESHLPIKQMDGLREASFGEYESGPNSEMWGMVAKETDCESIEDFFKKLVTNERHIGDSLSAIKKNDSMNIAEDFADLENRVLKTLEKIAKKESKDNEDKNIFIVSHGVTIIALLQSLHGKLKIDGPLLNASVSKVIYSDGKFTVETMGDTSYVENGRKMK